MGPAWRIRKQHGKGASGLVLGLSRRVTPIERMGLRAGLRRYGWELPPRGVLALMLLVGVFVVGLSTLWESREPDADLLITYLDSPVTHDDIESQEPKAVVPISPSRIAPEPEPLLSKAPTRPRSVSPAKPRPQIDALDSMPLSKPYAEQTKRSRTIARRPMPLRSDGSMPALPAVAAVGPGSSKSLQRTAPGTRRLGPAPPTLPALGAAHRIESTARAGQRVVATRTEISSSAETRRDNDLGGVPLGSLASCVSREREESLKRRVVARVPEPALCESPSGTYRFVETKNLNAFLMWIERAGDREAGDRCTELSLALDCLSDGVVKKETAKS